MTMTCNIKKIIHGIGFMMHILNSLFCHSLSLSLPLAFPARFSIERSGFDVNNSIEKWDEMKSRNGIECSKTTMMGIYGRFNEGQIRKATIAVYVATSSLSLCCSVQKGFIVTRDSLLRLRFCIIKFESHSSVKLLFSSQA